MCRRQSRDGHAEGRTGYIVQADGVAERHASGFTTVLATDAHLELRPHVSAITYRPFDEFSHALGIEHLKRIVGIDPSLHVLRQETARVITAQAEGRLRQVIGAE